MERKKRCRVIDAIAYVMLTAGTLFAGYTGIFACGSEMYWEPNIRKEAVKWAFLAAVSLLCGSLSFAALIYLSRRGKLTVASPGVDQSCAFGCFTVFVLIMGSLLASRISMIGK